MAWCDVTCRAVMWGCQRLACPPPPVSPCPCSQLGVNEKLLFSDLDVPQGVALRIKTHSDPIIKVAK